MARGNAFIGLLAATVCVALIAMSTSTANAVGPTVTGAGSTWVQIALDQWRADIAREGYSINYQGVGSTAGRTLYIGNQVDFAASEIPFEPAEINQLRGVNKHYQYMPDVAGGTSLMYNLHSPSGSRITNLKLNAEVAGKIFTGVINSWQANEIASLNPGLQIKETLLMPVVRSDGSGTSAQFSLYLADQAPAVWRPFVTAQGCPEPCSQWPPFPGSISAQFSDGVANHIANDSIGKGAIGYVEAGYAFGRGFPVASMQNASGNFTQPTAANVALSLTHATLNADLTQNLTNVYRGPEPNVYPMSSYSYMILPCVAPPTDFATCSTDVPSNFGPDKGAVLGTWLIYIACGGQRRAEPLGYSPLPPNLVRAVMDAVNRLPGHPATPPLDYQHCPNPTLAGTGGGGTPTPPPQSSSDAGTGQGGGGQSAGQGGGQTGSAGPSAEDLAKALTGGGSVDPSLLASSSVLPPGFSRVSVLDGGQRREMLDRALAAARKAQAPSRTPLWIGLLIILLASFLPMILVTVRGRKATHVLHRLGPGFPPNPTLPPQEVRE